MNDIIDAFVKITDLGLSPKRYRIWAALGMISAATDRQVWTSIRKGMALFPNLYILLVGPPGVGKSQAISAVRSSLETQPNLFLSQSSITHEGWIKLLSERFDDTLDDETMGRASMAMVLSEWGAFMRQAANDDMALLADAYDNEDISRYTISRKEDKAENLFVNILSAATPAWFAEGFPPNSYEQGLPARFHFIYVGEPDDPDRDFEFGEAPADQTRIGYAMLPLLDQVARYRGFVPWTISAGQKFNTWKNNGFQPKITDPMLAGYAIRRPMHVAKLAMLCAISRLPEKLQIEECDIQRAMDISFEAEPHMRHALVAAGGNIFQMRTDAICNFVISRYRETKKPVPEWEVRQRLGKLVPPYLIKSLLDELINSKRLTVKSGGEVPMRKLLPGVQAK